MANIIIFVHMMLQILSLNIILIICSYRSFKMENPKKIEILNKAVEVNSNLSSNELYEISIDKSEGKTTNDGALVVLTGKHTGRSVNDKFIVKDGENDEKIDWGKINAPISISNFNKIYESFLNYAQNKILYNHDLLGGADRNHSIGVSIITEYAWHGLFARHLLIKPKEDELKNFRGDYTIINFPGLKLDPKIHGTRSETVIAVNLKEKIILIAGTEYAGETKKSVFTLLNFLLPEKNIMPMHCSVNVGKNGDSAVFFGLSGTGKTTLSADPNRSLLGDDEHGWSDEGLFNFEGGCYAKLIRLSKTAEPEIYATTKMKTSVIENAILKDNGELDLDDGTITENTRGAYPLEFIPNVTIEERVNHPKNIIMLTADAFGVMPPIAKLNPDQAMYHFLSGYTAKVAGTEMGLSKDPTATFSTCFGAPFMPRRPIEYGNLLKEKISKHNADCWIVNTGWSGGPYGVGHRISLSDTRQLVSLALEGKLKDIEMRKDPNFGFEVPIKIEGIDQNLLNPKESWKDRIAYDQQANKLVKMFIDNFKQFEMYVEASVTDSGPTNQ